MKRLILQFLAAAAGACAGAAAFAVLWKHVDRFFYLSLGLNIHCEDCHTEALSLLFGFMPLAAACCVFAFSRLVYKQYGLSCLLGAFLGGALIGGTICVFALKMASGAAAALVAVSVTGAAAAAGCNISRRMTARASAMTGR